MILLNFSGSGMQIEGRQNTVSTAALKPRKKKKTLVTAALIPCKHSNILKYFLPYQIWFRPYHLYKVVQIQEFKYKRV